MRRLLLAMGFVCVVGLCGCSSGFKPGECVEYATDRGEVRSHEDPRFDRTPMRVLGKTAPGMYLVEWRTIYRPDGIHESAQSETYKIAIPERTEQEHLVKVLCGSRELGRSR